ncbi:MAG: hypothetical protein U0516_01860 [Candidatus Saccharibacteria bacterium]
MSEISDEKFFKALDKDLYEKFLSRGEEYFDDAMMRWAYLRIQAAREAKKRAELARLENTRIQSESIKLRRPYFS